MPKRIPIAAAERFCKEQKCLQVIILAWDGEITHVVTYGTTVRGCREAAAGGRQVAKALELNEL